MHQPDMRGEYIALRSYSMQELCTGITGIRTKALPYFLALLLCRHECYVQVMAISQLIRSEFDGARDLSGIGGVENGKDAAEFLLLGANSVQVRRPTTGALGNAYAWAERSAVNCCSSAFSCFICQAGGYGACKISLKGACMP